jgi:hypothetical protein
MNTKNYTNMVEAIEELKKRGFIANFEFLDQTFRDVDSGRTFKAANSLSWNTIVSRAQAIPTTCLSSMP